MNNASYDQSNKVAANAAIALGVVTVGFAAGLYTPPVEAQPGPVGTPYWNEAATMYICWCDGGNYCAPCAS